MARTKVMNVWTAIVTAFLALFTALGLVSTTAAAAVPQTATTRNSDGGPSLTVPAMSAWSLHHARSLPPTMKQRIHAEAHGTSPSCRRRPLTDPTMEALLATLPCSPVTSAAEPLTPDDTPLQR